jgi:Na+/phosphate symporter
MTVYNVFTLLGGLAFFLFGMKLLGESLEQRAGNRLKPILESLTTKPAKGVLVGLVSQQLFNLHQLLQ